MREEGTIRASSTAAGINATRNLKPLRFATPLLSDARTEPFRNARPSCTVHQERDEFPPHYGNSFRYMTIIP